VKEPISIIIRSKNEEKTIKKTLAAIALQTIKPKEIILVDNLSSDRTASIAKSYGCKIVTIDEPFNHARSCNLGMEKAKSEIVAFLNGHAFLANATCLEKGLENFAEPKVAGVFGSQYTDERASIWESIDNALGQYSVTSFNRRNLKRYTSVGHYPGLMSTICAALRKSLWKKYPFDEKLSEDLGGGEDTDWGLHCIKLGYMIVQEPEFKAYHCHGENLQKFLQRRSGYGEINAGIKARYGIS